MPAAASARASSKATPRARSASSCASSSCCRSRSPRWPKRKPGASAPSASSGAYPPGTCRCSPGSWPPLRAPGCHWRRRCSRSHNRPKSRACRASCSACAHASWRATPSPTASRNSRASFPRSIAPPWRRADYTESREQIRQKVLAAMLYPIVLTVMCFAIVSLLLVFVVPKVVAVFETTKAKLPLITRVLIATSGFFRDYGLYLVVGAVIAFVLFRRWQRDPAARRRYHRFQLRVPLLGKLTRGFNTARFTRTFSILSASSVPVLEALRIAGEVVTNLPMRDAVADAAARVREGAPIGRSLGLSRMFPPMTIHLISSGESSGQLENMLERAATSQERELDGLLSALVGLLGPLLIIVMGLFVMGIVFAMLLPIFQMNQLIH